MKIKFEARKLRISSDRIPEEDKDYTRKTGEIEADSLDAAIIAIKRGDVDIDPPLAVRSVSVTGPNSVLVRLVEGVKKAPKKAKPKLRRRAPRGQR